MHGYQEPRENEEKTPNGPEELPQNKSYLGKRIREILPVGFPTIVTLCGSTRFADAFRQAMKEETLAGKIVLSVGLLGHSEGIDMNGSVKAALDELHKRKIDLADDVYILNQGGYIGESTRSELEYARKRGKTIRFLEPEAG